MAETEIASAGVSASVSSTEIKDTIMDETTNENEPNYEISKFKLIKILSNNINRKMIAVLGNFPHTSETDSAVILLEKNAFKENDVKTDDNNSNYFNDKMQITLDFINNIYGSFQCFPPADLNGVKATVIYPATEKHIAKFSPRQKYIVQETPDLYENITKPYLESEQFSLDWVYNILEHKQEQDRIIYEDPDLENGFILLPDLKWDGKTLETLYCLVIVHKRNLKSLRDLNSSHLNLLKNIYDSGCKAIENKFGLKCQQLRIYVHYQPSFYHLHVHFNSLKNEFPGIYCEKSHLLQTIINNIELMSNYYQKCTIPMALYEGDHLLDKFIEKNIIDKINDEEKAQDESKTTDTNDIIST